MLFDIYFNSEIMSWHNRSGIDEHSEKSGSRYRPVNFRGFPIITSWPGPVVGNRKGFLFVWFLNSKFSLKQSTYSVLMFFKLIFLIILCRPQMKHFLSYASDNQVNITEMQDMDLYSRIMFYVGIAVILMFFALGAFILISPVFNYVPKNFRTILAVFIILYGFFRLIQVYQKYKNSREENL